MPSGVGARFILTIYHISESTRGSARRRPASEQGWFLGPPSHARSFGSGYVSYGRPKAVQVDLAKRLHRAWRKAAFCNPPYAESRGSDESDP